MTTETLAPWGDLVPDAPRMTVADLLRLPDDGFQYEVVEGKLIRMPPSGIDASHLAVRLIIELGAYVRDRRLGVVTGADGTYELAPGTGLAPDVAFLPAGRVPPPNSPEYRQAARGAPALAVEVASPTQYRPEMAAKARRYLGAGSLLVWVVWPKRQQIDVWRPGNTQPSMTLGIGDAVDGEDVVPGFRYPLADLFAFS